MTLSDAGEFDQGTPEAKDAPPEEVRESKEVSEVKEGTEQVDKATFEPEVVVETQGSFEQAESIEAAFTEAVEVTSENESLSESSQSEAAPEKQSKGGSKEKAGASRKPEGKGEKGDKKEMPTPGQMGRDHKPGINAPGEGVSKKPHDDRNESASPGPRGPNRGSAPGSGEPDPVPPSDVSPGTSGPAESSDTAQAESNVASDTPAAVEASDPAQAEGNVSTNDSAPPPASDTAEPPGSGSSDSAAGDLASNSEAVSDYLDPEKDFEEYRSQRMGAAFMKLNILDPEDNVEVRKLISRDDFQTDLLATQEQVQDKISVGDWPQSVDYPTVQRDENGEISTGKESVTFNNEDEAQAFLEDLGPDKTDDQVTRKKEAMGDPRQPETAKPHDPGEMSKGKKEMGGSPEDKMRNTAKRNTRGTEEKPSKPESGTRSKPSASAEVGNDLSELNSPSSIEVPTNSYRDKVSEMAEDGMTEQERIELQAMQQEQFPIIQTISQIMKQWDDIVKAAIRNMK